MQNTLKRGDAQSPRVDFATYSGFTALFLVSLVFSILAVIHAVRAEPLPAKDAKDAKAIMTRNEDARKVADVQSSAALTTGTAPGGAGEKVKTFTWWRKLTGDKVRYNTLTRFHSPAEVRGEGILFLERENDQNDVQMYLPAYKKVRRVESQAQSGSFMGSEFSYADIATPHVADYHHKLVKDSDECGDDAKAKCFVIESVPATDAVKERTGYSKTVQWIRQADYMTARAEFHGLDGKLKKRMQASEIKEVDASQHKWMAHRVRIENALNGKYTTLSFSNVKVNRGIPDSTFTVQNLSREK